MQTYQVADESFVLSAPLPIPGVGVLPINAAVIRAKEPVLLDTSAPIHRSAYLAAVSALLDPRDVRWIFLTHDDRDHSGNLLQVLELCPNARLITTFAGLGRMSEEWQLPPHRVLLLNDGEQFEAGDRSFVAVRPPVFDAPGTRGLFDTKTRVYFSVDAFGAPVEKICADSSEVPAELYESNLLWFNRVNHPWHELIDASKFEAQVDRIRRLHAETIVSGHGPVVHGRSDEVCALLSRVAHLEAVPLPSQKDLMALAAAH
jgi:flavorubredoxin